MPYESADAVAVLELPALPEYVKKPFPWRDWVAVQELEIRYHNMGISGLGYWGLGIPQYV